MSLEDMLKAAAGVPEIDEAGIALGLTALEREYRRRQDDDIARARHAAFLDSLELEQGAYELAQRHEGDGNLRAAARWYKVAAKHDHGDAALRLGETLGLLAERCAGHEDDYSARREVLYLIREAAHAYAEAYAAGYPEAADKIDEMLAAHSRQKTPPSAEPAPAACSYVRDFAAGSDVLREEEIRELSRHAAQCMPCMAEFVKQITAVAAALPTGHVHVG